MKCNTCQSETTDFYKGHYSCRSCTIARQKKWYRENKSRNYENAKNSKARRPDAVRRYGKTWREKHREKIRIYNSARRGRERGAQGHYTQAEIRHLYQAQHGLCAFCFCDLSISGYHIDHLIPLCKGGSNHIQNILLLCPPCNLKKGSNYPPNPV